LIAPGKTGLTFDPHNKNDIIRSLTAWSTKMKDEKDEIRKTCSTYYFSNFTPEINKGKLLAIYQDAIHDKKRNK